MSLWAVFWVGVYVVALAFAVYLLPFKIFPLLARKQMEYTRKLISKDYPQTVPNWGTRMRGCPFDPEEIEECLGDLADEWDLEYPDLKIEDIEGKLNGLLIWFVPADKEVEEKTGGEANRHIEDAYGRYIAGDHQGDEVRVVYNDKDVNMPKWERVGRTALIHECCHELDELLGDSGVEHRPDIYGPDGLVVRVKRMHS